jgi:hypothetical protein
MALFMIITILLVPLTGCTGNDEEIVIVESEEPDWINDRGENPNAWNLTLKNSQWLEIKSAFQIWEEKDGQILQVPMYIISGEWQMIGMEYSMEYSPVFGGEYNYCVYYRDGSCFATTSDSDYSLVEWSIIYRIHNV